MPLSATAAYNTITFDYDTNVYLWGINYTVTVQSGSMVAGFDVTSKSIELDMENGSTITFVSADQKTMTNNLDVKTTCGKTSSSLTLTSSKTQSVSVDIGGSCSNAIRAVIPLGLSIAGDTQSTTSFQEAKDTAQDTIQTATTSPSFQPTNIKPFSQMTVTELKAEIIRITEFIIQLSLQLSQMSEPSTGKLAQDLQYGSSGEQVSLLQTWLSKNPEIYPAGIVSGWFGSLTKQSVTKFQEKYSEEILIPLGLTSGTGYVGPSTRAKLNSLYSEQ